MFFTQFADFVQIERTPLWSCTSGFRSNNEGYVIHADGFAVGTCMPVRDAQGWVCLLNTPELTELLMAPNRNDVVGLALRIANQLCAKAAFGSADP